MASQTANNGLDLNAAVIALFQVPDTLYKAWEEHVPQTAQVTLSKASEASGVPKKYLLWIVLTLGFYVLTGRAGDICYRIVATLYPGYMSLKALESTNRERSTRWLKYWVIHAAIEFVCFFTPSFIDQLASISMMKTIFVLWCILPITPSGTDIVYENLGGVSKKMRKLALESVRLLSEESQAGGVSEVADEKLGRAACEHGSVGDRSRTKKSACGDQPVFKVREMRLRHLQGRKRPQHDPESPSSDEIRPRRITKKHTQDVLELNQYEKQKEDTPKSKQETTPDAEPEKPAEAAAPTEPETQTQEEAEVPPNPILIESARKELAGKPTSTNLTPREDLFQLLKACAKVNKEMKANSKSRNGTSTEDQRRLTVLKRADPKILAFIDEKRASRYNKK